MARGDSAPDSDTRYFGLVKCDTNAAFQVLDSRKRGLPQCHPLSLNLNLKAPRSGGGSQQNRPQDTPESIKNYVGLNEARAFLDASARNGKYVKIMTFDDKGQMEEQVIMNANRVQATKMQPQIEATTSQFQGVRISESFDRPQKSLEQSPTDYSRGTSLSTSSAQGSLQMGTEGEFLDVSRREKRVASVPLSRSPSPAEEEEDGPIMTDKVTKHFRLGDSVAIERFYERSFSAVQQTAMKSITKSWIKEIEPDKQKKFPYSGGEKPPWWPEGCYYREPDHLKKPDRQILAVAILRYAIQDYERFKGTGVDRLERATFEKANIEFDKESEAKIKQRKEILKQVFRTARLEQNLIQDERDDSDMIAVWEFEDPSPAKPRKRQRKRTSLKKQAPTVKAAQQVEQIGDHLAPLPALDVKPELDLSIHVCNNNNNDVPYPPEPDNQTANIITEHGNNIWDQSCHASPQRYYPATQSCPASAIEMHQQQQDIQYHTTTSRFTSFDDATMDTDYHQIADSSPAIMRQELGSASFSTTPTLPDQVQWPYSELNMQIPHMPIQQPHGLPVRPPQHSPIQQQHTSVVFPVTWDQRSWEATPGASYQQPMQPGDYRPTLN
jgi:hypothetical protein